MRGSHVRNALGERYKARQVLHRLAVAEHWLAPSVEAFSRFGMCTRTQRECNSEMMFSQSQGSLLEKGVRARRRR
eukprot:5780064-Pleurochrysis_carterae.AAC.5